MGFPVEETNLGKDLATTGGGVVEREDLERVCLRVEGVLHEIDGMVRLHEEVEVLEGLSRKERLHVVLRLQPRFLHGHRPKGT